MLETIGDSFTTEVCTSNIRETETGRLLLYLGFIAETISLVFLFLLYHPPQHPKGVPWREGLAGLDYVGALLVAPGVVLTLVGIIFTVSSQIISD